MANKQYCFDINNPDNYDFDVEDLKKFVQKLYIGKKDGQFDKDSKIPFTIIYTDTSSDHNVCIKMKGTSKKNQEQVESINKKLKPKNLKWKNNISLSEPYEFKDNFAHWQPTSETFEKKDGKHWNSLRHKGPYFGDLLNPYKPLGASLTYEGKKYKLTPEEEKIASFYAKRKISESSDKIVVKWTKDSVFNKNFWNDFKTYLTTDHKKIFKSFSKIGWEDLIAKMEANKSSEQEKEATKVKNAELEKKYGHAYIDGNKEKVGNFKIEPQGIFMGRGENPKRGKVKKMFLPEDVTINIGPNDPIPSPPTGHTWGQVVTDQRKRWLASYWDPITSENKYIQLGADSSFKGKSDYSKYENARKLERYIKTVRKKYMDDASSSNTTKKQLATVLYLIDHFGVRVGNEKGEEEADTVGATTLRVDHVKLKPPNHIIFDFLGKDSIRFYKELEVPEQIYNNFKEMVKGKKGSEQVFDAIDSSKINKYLKESDKNFSAKVFRTRLASSIMYDALKEVKIPKNATTDKIKILFNKANAKVADVLNHTRNVTKKDEEVIKKLQQDLKDAKKDLAKAKKEGKKTKTKEKSVERIKNKIEEKKDKMNVAVSTSLKNYIDPRLVVSWAKNQEVDLKNIYSKTLITQFHWAIETIDKNWNWMTSPLDCNPDLEPSESKDDKPKGDRPKKKSPKRRDIPKKKSPKRRDRPKKKSPKRRDKTKKKSPKRRDKTKKKSPKNTTLGPGTIEDYKLLLLICEDPDEYKNHLSKIPKNVLKWIYEFSKYAIQKGIDKKINDYIVRFYENGPDPVSDTNSSEDEFDNLPIWAEKMWKKKMSEADSPSVYTQNCKENYEICPQNPNTCVYKGLPEDIKREACEVTLENPLGPNQVLTLPITLEEKRGRFTFSEYKPEFPVAHALNTNLGPIIPDSRVVDNKLLEYIKNKR